MAFMTIDLTDGGQITIGEASEGGFNRQEGENPSISVRFNIWGAENASTAYLALMNYLHENFDDGAGGIANYDLPLDNVQLNSTANQFLYNADCTFQYRYNTNASSNSPNDTNSNINSSAYQMPEVEDADYSFDTTGGSAHIKYGIATLGSARYDGTTPIDYGSVIGPREDGGADGFDIVTPTMNFQITLSLPKTWFTLPYRLAIANATGCINATPWGGYAAGCVLFKGVSARATWMKWTNRVGFVQRDWYWRAAFSFEAATVGTDVVGGVSLVKRGFDVVSKAYASYADQTTGATVSVPEQVDIIQVYPAYEFALLNLNMPS